MTVKRLRMYYSIIFTGLFFPKRERKKKPFPTNTSLEIFHSGSSFPWSALEGILCNQYRLFLSTANNTHLDPVTFQFNLHICDPMAKTIFFCISSFFLTIFLLFQFLLEFLFFPIAFSRLCLLPLFIQYRFIFFFFLLFTIFFLESFFRVYSCFLIISFVSFPLLFHR